MSTQPGLQLPRNVPLAFTRGADFALAAEVVDANGSPVDVSGWTITADLLLNGTVVEVDEAGVLDTAVTGDDDNVIEITADADMTAELVIGARYRWRLTIDNGQTRDWIGGPARVAKPGESTDVDGAGSSVTVRLADGLRLVVSMTPSVAAIDARVGVLEEFAAEVPSQYARLASPTFTGNVVVPDADADGEALNTQTARRLFPPALREFKLAGNYSAAVWGALETNRTPAEATMYLMPIWLPVTGISGVQVRVLATAGSTGAVVRAGIYASGSDDRPSALVAEGDNTVAVTSINSTVNVPFTGLSISTPGLYWVAIVIQGGATTRPILSAIQGNSPYVSGPGPGTANAAYTVASVSGSLPSPCPAIHASTATNFWAVNVGVVAANP